MKASLLAGILSLVAATSTAQTTFEITPFAGYQFGGELAVVGDEPVRHDLDQSPTWGVVLDYRITGAESVELYYSSQSTDLLTGADGPKVGVEHLQIGAIREYGPSRPVNPYVGITLGAARFDVLDDSDTRFSGGVTFGAKMIVSDHLGFRFDGRVFGVSTGTGAIGCDGDSCVGYPDTSIIWQYTVNAGVIIHFGER